MAPRRMAAAAAQADKIRVPTKGRSPRARGILVKRRAWLVIAALAAGSCSSESPPARSGPVDAFLFDLVGCYSFTALPDSAYTMGSDLDWPSGVELVGRRSDPDYPRSYSAEVLDSVWGSLGSPLGTARQLAADSVVFNWGVTSYRLEVLGDGRLHGVATIALSPPEVVGSVTGTAVPCRD